MNRRALFSARPSDVERRLTKRLGTALITAVLTLSVSGCGDLWRVFFPSNHHDTVAPEIPSLSRPAILVFSKTNGYRHDEALESGLPAISEIANEQGWSIFTTENGAVHDAETLDRFDVVFWFQQSGNVLSDEQRSALRSWIEAGGAFLGVHGTGGDSTYDWAWQPGTLVGAQFIGHPMNPQFQEATVRIEDPKHPVVAGLPTEWRRVDEWYSFEKSPRGPGVQVLASLDESTYTPRMKIALIDRDLRMGEDHPIIWTHCIGRGHAIYSALGHQAEAYSEPAHRQLLTNALEWLIQSSGETCSISDESPNEAL